MKTIQCLNDIEALKAVDELPKLMIQTIEEDFLCLYEAEGAETDLLQFRLPFSKALILLEVGDDVMKEVNDPFHLEYVEKVTEGEKAYYRLAKRFDHDFQLIYTLAGIHDDIAEEWLAQQARYDERGIQND
jgi:hypothetical protein